VSSSGPRSTLKGELAVDVHPGKVRTPQPALGTPSLRSRRFLLPACTRPTPPHGRACAVSLHPPRRPRRRPRRARKLACRTAGASAALAVSTRTPEQERLLTCRHSPHSPLTSHSPPRSILHHLCPTTAYCPPRCLPSEPVLLALAHRGTHPGGGQRLRGHAPFERHHLRGRTLQRRPGARARLHKNSYQHPTANRQPPTANCQHATPTAADGEARARQRPSKDPGLPRLNSAARRRCGRHRSARPGRGAGHVCAAPQLCAAGRRRLGPRDRHVVRAPAGEKGGWCPLLVPSGRQLYSSCARGRSRRCVLAPRPGRCVTHPASALASTRSPGP
jgi:hypothetical protein